MSARYSWFRARALSTALGIAVFLGAACGPVALYLAVTDDERSAVPQIQLPDHRAGVAGEFASLFVAAFLRGDDLTFFNPALRANESGLLVERVAAVRTTERGEGLFDVIVAADAVEFVAGSEEQFRPIGLLFYAVGVNVDRNGNLGVLGLPSTVAQPDPAEGYPMAITDLRLPTSPEVAGLAQTLDGFFAAYLTGAADVALFSAPNAGIDAVRPAPFGQAKIFELGWGPVPGIDEPTLRLARVVVDAVSTSGQQRLEYSIVMAERDGRWEVSQLLNAPVVLKQET
ncbi:MAG: conjugal transfer protein [Actinomycetota bacterium]